MSGPQAVRGGRHDAVVRDQRVVDRRQPQKEVHGRLDLHLHRPRAHFRQSLQTDEVLFSFHALL